MAFSGGNVVYTDSTHAGTLTQTVANMAIAPIANRWYSFTYTITGSSGTTTASITTSFAQFAQTLNTANGTYTIVFHSASAPSDFIISATSSAGGAFTLTSVSLQVLNTASGNYSVSSRKTTSIPASNVTVAFS
jgi:hypothetical protein